MYGRLPVVPEHVDRRKLSEILGVLWYTLMFGGLPVVE